jgi:hypothetical protein
MKQFDEWNDIKKTTEENLTIAQFRQKEIFSTSIGQNIGYEQNGKGEEFLRPVLIYKKFSNRLFLGIPLSKTQKIGDFYHSFEFHRGVMSTALLSQIRLFDAKRLRYRMGMINKAYFETISMKLKNLLEVTP